MIPLFGNFALWLSLFFVVLQIIYSRKEKNNLVLQINRVAVIGLLACSLLTFASLTVSHLNSDFTLVNVYQNSHSTKPLLYKIAGVWGNHEGSMLLWILVLTIFNYFIFRSYNKNNFKFISNTLESQGIIIIGFLIFTIFTSNPFKLMKSIPVYVLGFNPI